MADVLINNEGNIALFTPASSEARTWVEDNLELEPWQWFGGHSFAVEHNFVAAIVDGMEQDGLSIDRPRTASKVATEPQVNLRPQVAPGNSSVQPNPPAPAAMGQKGPIMDTPAQSGEKRTVPPELPHAALYMMSSIGAKMARGGWKRISMNTVQSDDNAYTITCIDPTRRGRYFLLKNLETGESSEHRTMTEAKHRVKVLRGEVEEPLEVNQEPKVLATETM